MIVKASRTASYPEFRSITDKPSARWQRRGKFAARKSLSQAKQMAHTVSITDRDLVFAKDLDSLPRHFRATVHAEGCIQITAGWHIALSATNEIAQCAAKSLQQFFTKYCGMELPTRVVGGPAANVIEILWNPGESEGYSIHVTQSRIRIIGDSPAGALYGAHRLQWMMGEHGGPFVPLGNHKFHPSLQERITSTPFHQGLDDAGDPLTYTDGYLDLMVHYGYNGLHFYFDVLDYVAESVNYEELANAEAPGRLERLAELSERASRYNIGVYLHPNILTLPIDHAVFARHPELRGATTWGPQRVCLCSSQPATTRLCVDVMNGMMRHAPDIRGVIAIVGGECLTHCYMRPCPRTKAGTNCPVCQRRPPSEVVASFVNQIGEGLLEQHPELSFIVWPYSAHLWSESPEQREFIGLMSPRLGFMTCREKDAWIRKDGVDLSVFDYSISYIGPSEPYRIQRELCRAKGIPFYVNTESSITLELYNLPYIPVMESWQQRWRGICSDDMRGVYAIWRQSGLIGTLSDELGFRETWQSGHNTDALETIATRLAGSAGCSELLAAWNLFSRAFSRIVMAVGTSGFPYFRGPMYLGPAHPLILFGEEAARLPHTFCPVDPLYFELYKDVDLSKAPRHPLYFDDYRWTLPLGVESMLRSYSEADEQWTEGLARLDAAIAMADPALRPNLMRERDVALMANLSLKATVNLAKFQLQRERATRQPVRDSEVDEIHDRLVTIVEEDLKNAERGYELAKRDYRFGYGFQCGKVFDAQMILEKIQFTRNVLLPDIEQFFYVLVSHSFARTYGDGGRMM